MTGLALTGTIRRGTFELTCDVDVHPGEIVAVLGPNGSGKSTLLDAVSGWLPLTSGELRLGTDVWDDGRHRLAPGERRAGRCQP